MFKFNKGTRVDGEMNSPTWKKRLRNVLLGIYIATTLTGIGAGLAGLSTHDIAEKVFKYQHGQHINDEEMLKRISIGYDEIIGKNENAFSADPENNIIDPAHQRAYRNTVMIVTENDILHNGKSEDREISFGSGTIISNSASKESGGNNVIVTANHVVGGKQVGSEFLAGNGRCSNSSKTFKNGDTIKHICYVYSSSGYPLGKAEVLYVKNSVDNIKMSEMAKSDLAVMKITPSDDTYEQLDGVPLAKEIAINMFIVKCDKKYKTADHRVIDAGIGEGNSGGGVFNDNGELISIISSRIGGVKGDSDTINLFIGNALGYSDAKMDMGSLISDQMEMLKYERGEASAQLLKRLPDIADGINPEIPNDLIGVGDFQGVNRPALPSSNIGVFTSLADPGFLAHLGNAGRGMRSVENYEAGAKIFSTGFPYSVPLSIEMSVPGSKAFISTNNRGPSPTMP